MEKVVTTEQIKKVGELSNLNLNSQELEDFSDVFTDILGYINVLSELKLDDLDPTFQVTGTTNVFMVGEQNKVTLDQKNALSNAKETIRGLFGTEGVFDRD